MKKPSARLLRMWPITGSLAVTLMLSSGCEQGETTDSSKKAPPNPAPRADLGVTVQPKLPRTESEEASNVEKDLHRDLAPPLVKPGATGPTAPPAGRPGTP